MGKKSRGILGYMTTPCIEIHQSRKKLPHDGLQRHRRTRVSHGRAQNTHTRGKRSQIHRRRRTRRGATAPRVHARASRKRSGGSAAPRSSRHHPRTRKAIRGGGFMNTIKLHFNPAERDTDAEEVWWKFDLTSKKPRWKLKWSTKNKFICYLPSLEDGKKSHTCIVFHSKNKTETEPSYYATDGCYDYFLSYTTTRMGHTCLLLRLCRFPP